MKTKVAIRLRKSMKKCKGCEAIPPLRDLVQSQPEVLIWLNFRSTRKRLYGELVSKLDDGLVVSNKVCRQHRDQIMRATGALFEIEFHPDGSLIEALPRLKKGRSWFTLFWRDPQFVKKKDHGTWLKQAHRLNRVVNGFEKLPVMPKNLKEVTLFGTSDQLMLDLDGKRGYAKLYLNTIGENVVVTKNEDVHIPPGVHAGVPVFTLDELVKLRHLVGMKPDPEMVRGAWLLKKYIGASVVK